MKNNFRISVAAFVFLINWNILLSQNPNTNLPLSTMQGFFTRTVENIQESDSIAGNFYYYDAGKLFFKIVFPINQIMIIENNITTIYYPDTNEGFELESVNPMILPLVTGILAAIREDYGLSVIGFKMYDQKLSNDTLITYWSYPPAPDKAGIHIIKNYDDKLYSTEYQAPDSISRVKTYFKQYVDLEDFLIPTVVQSEAVSVKGKNRELVRLSSLKINTSIAKDIKFYKIPENADMKKRKW